MSYVNRESVSTKLRNTLTPTANSLIISSGGEDGEQWVLIYSEKELESYYSGSNIEKKNSVASYKPEYSFTISCGKHIPWYFHKWVEGVGFHKSLKTDVHSSFLHNCINLEATKCTQQVKWCINCCASR